ncbi:toxin glutamine deamidase domain-containing protein [Spirillospora sp. NPDC047279]|uniref:toxin glutamine deamidase domain-containing protein n=1 Tax=Spirillospora sp. NPDC047279 TaxID=3155478 RepID=UPI0033F5CBAC
MSRAERAASELVRVKGLAEEHGGALRRAYQLLYDGALVGPAASGLFARLTESHGSARSGFYDAFDLVQRLAAEAEGGPPRVGEPYVPGPPRGGLRASGDVRSGSPDLLNLLATELGRAGRAWGDAGDDLARVLSGLGLGTGPARAIARAGSGVAAQQAEVRRRRDEFLRADQQAAIQAAMNTVHATAQAIGSAQAQRPGLLKTAWNAGWDIYVKRYLGGVAEGVKGIGLTALASNAATAPFYGMVDREGWMQRSLVGQANGLWNGVQHPVEFGKAIINWDQWKEDPVRAYGEMVPGAILAVSTGGAGTASNAGSKLSMVAGKFGKVKRIEPRTSPIRPTPSPTTPLHDNPKVARHSRTATQKELDHKFPNLKNVNPQFHSGKSGFDINCQSCVVNVDRQLAGEAPSSAVPRHLKYPSKVTWPDSVTKNVGPGGSFRAVNDYDDIIKELLKGGDGSRGVVHGLRVDPATGVPRAGHVFNVVNLGGKIHFIDGQSGTWAVLEKYAHLEFYRTN